MVQFIQYVRIAAELVYDLGLHQGNGADGIASSQECRERHMDGIRAYLSYCYLISSLVVPHPS
jgi:hypothetical protein